MIFNKVQLLVRFLNQTSRRCLVLNKPSLKTYFEYSKVHNILYHECFGYCILRFVVKRSRHIQINIPGPNFLSSQTHRRIWADEFWNLIYKSINILWRSTVNKEARVVFTSLSQMMTWQLIFNDLTYQIRFIFNSLLVCFTVIVSLLWSPYKRCKILQNLHS